MVPTGTDHAWGAGRRAPSQQTMFAPYSGYWRRAWANSIDTLIVSVVGAFALGILQLISWFALETVQSCKVRAGFRVCTGGDWVALAYVGASIVAWLTIWFMFIPLRMGRTGQTIGMAQMGIRAQAPESAANIGVGPAVLLNLVNQTAVYIGSAMLIVGVVTAANESLAGPIAGALVLLGLAVATVPPALMILIDRRHQTLGDKAANAVVVEVDQPSWFGLASLVCGATLFPLAIIFGHLGLRETRWVARRKSGRGMALAGTALGYSVPLIALIAFGFSFTTKRIESVNSKDCVAFRKELVVSLDSYRTLNGAYPNSLNPMGGDLYTGVDIDLETWSYDAAPDGSSYALKGIGDCARK